MLRTKLFVVISIAAVLLCSFPANPRLPVAAAAPQKPKYNVLFIASDDLRPTLGTYGNAIVKTPNLDKLALQGVRFDRAYAQYPLCNPSRSSLLTGKYPTQTSILDNEYYFRALHPELVSLTQHFKANGYATLRSGKVFHGGIDDTDSWTEGGEAREFTGAKRPPSNPDSADRNVAV
jgi:arylsulfatase A-like enzyme